MFLENQNQYRDQMQSPAFQPEAGYSKAYAKWTEDNKNVLHTWDSETRVQSFSDAVQADTEARLLNLIELKQLDPDTAKEHKTLAKRGQLILVSTDEGKTFDKYLTPEEAKTADPLAYQIYSPTFRSSTNNLKEVIEEQTLLAVVKNAKEIYKAENEQGGSIWRIEDATLKNGVVHLEVARTARSVEDENVHFALEIGVDQPANLPLVYDKIDSKGEHKKVQETQLPEEFGIAQEDPNLAPLSEETLLTTLQVETVDNSKKAASESIKKAGLSTWATLEALNYVSQEARATEQAYLARMAMERPLTQVAGNKPVANVMAAKAAIKARFARQNEALQKGITFEKEIKKEIKQQEKVAQSADRSDKKAKSKRWSASQKNLAKGTGLAAAAAGGLAGLLTGSSMFVSHITLFQ